MYYDPTERKTFYRFFTYMFVHHALDHIFFNLIIQLFLGIALELVHCWWRVALVYLAGVISGSLGTSFMNPCKGLVGASGGVYALITAHIATIFMNWHEMDSAVYQLFVFLILCSSNISMEINHYLTAEKDNVGHFAHFYGGIAGLLVGIGVLRNLNARPYQKKIWYVAMSIYFVLMMAAIFYHVVGTRFPTRANYEELCSGKKAQI